eukprot:413947_1
MAQQSSDEQKQHNALSGQGVFKWEVTGDLLTQFKNAKHKQKFYSPPFKTIDGTIWKIRFYPRGDQSPEYCKIYLKCDTLCANKARIGVNYSFNIRELDWSYDMGETFRYDGATSGPPNPFKPQVLNDLSTLTIECAVEETMNVSEGTSYFEWNVTNRLLRQWKEAKYKQVFFSPRFDAIGGVWYFGIYPNGKTTEGEAYLYIWCQSLTSDQMNVCHVTQSNNSQMHLDGHTIKKGGSFACKSPFQHKNILNEASVTIGTKLFAKESIDNAEARFISKLYANKAQSPKEWTEYFITESNRAMALLSRLGLGHYGSILAANACFTMKQLRDSVCDLKGIGVKAQGARKRIVAGVNAHYSIAHKTRSHAQSNQRDVDSKESLEEETLKAGITQSEHGFIQWKITGYLLKQFKNAKHKQKFYSPPFKTIDGTIWKIRFYPRGDQSPEYCKIYLKCDTLCANKARIGVNYSFNIRELDWSYDMGETFRYDGATSGPPNPFKPQVLNDLSTLTIECAVEETMNVSEGTSYFEWNVTNRLLRQWKEAKYKQVFFSPRFDAIGGVWYFGIYPNGKTTEGEAYLYIWCQSLTSDQMNVCHVTQSNNSQMHLDGHTIKKGGSFACKSPFQHKNILNEASVTIGTKLFAKESIDNAEARFISKLYANKAQSPKEWTEYFITESNQVTKWLIRLGLSQYTAVFKANECKSMEDIQDLTVDDLKEMGIKAFGARNRIIRGIKEHFTTAAAATNPMQRNEERKENDTANILDGNSSMEANKPIKRADNPLTMFFGIETYLGKMYKNLNDIHDDERRLRHTFEEELGYQFESNEYKDKIWTRADAIQWIRSKRDEILIKKGRVQYNALIFCAASHGSTHSIICSDGQPLETSTIRSMFAWNVNESFTNMPKVFIFNCCRTPFVKQPATSIARGGPGAGYGLTMTGTEGKEVFGAKLSSFVAAAFSESEGKRGLYDIFKSAKEKAKYEMG